jgi:ribonuclease D
MRDIMNILIFQNDLPKDLEVKGNIAIDTETMGLKLHRDRLCLIQIADENGKVYLIQFDGNDYKAPNLTKLFLEPERMKIFHFARFDLAMIQKNLEIEMQNIFCTKIASKLSRTYTDMHGLKELVRELLGIQISKQQQSSNWSSMDLSSEQKEYAARDVIYLHKLAHILEEMLIKNSRRDIAYKLFSFLPTIASLDLMGWENEEIFAHH